MSNSNQMFLNKTVLLQTLSELNLNGLKIDYIDANTFEDLNSIRKLYLNWNLLSHVDATLFKGLNNLEELWLESNNIIVFDLNALNGMTNLEKVCIYNNPISKYFPDRLKDICRGNPKCIVKIKEPCDTYPTSSLSSSTKLTTANSFKGFNLF